MSTELPMPSLQAGTSSEQVAYNDALETYQQNSDWWTVFAAFDLPDFNPSPLWISKKTGVVVNEVVEALEGLIVLGYLRKENGAFYPVKGKDFVKFDVKRKSKAEVLDEHAVISQQILNHLHPNALSAVDNRCFASNLEVLKELYADIDAAFDRAFKKSQEAKNNDRIYKVTFTAVDVINKVQANGRGN